MKVQEIVPYLSIKNAHEAVLFYARVFETEPWLLLHMPDGRVMHCEFRIASLRLLLSEELPEHGGQPSPDSLNGTSVTIHLYVDDCNQMFARMIENGSQSLMDPEDMFWGERFARVRDPFGHEWGITTIVQEMTPGEIQASAAKIFEAADNSTQG